MHYARNLTIDAQSDRAYLNTITSVGGSVWIFAPGNQLPRCVSVGGYVSIEAPGNHLPMCQTVGNSVRIEAPGNHLPRCVSVGGRPVADQATADARLLRIAEVVLQNPKRLDMKRWHSECGTAHCISGWAQVHAVLDDLPWFEIDPLTALRDGNVLLGMKHSGLFFLDDDEALAALRAHRDAMQGRD